MSEKSEIPFAPRGTADEIETGLAFAPKFDAGGVLAAVATDARTGDVLMLAWMNAEALALSIETGIAHFWSRSRSKLWRKGEESGNELHIIDMRTDCDQDAVWMRVEVKGAGVACHTGRRSCFYRSIALGAAPPTPLELLPAADGADAGPGAGSKVG